MRGVYIYTATMEVGTRPVMVRTAMRSETGLKRGLGRFGIDRDQWRIQDFGKGGGMRHMVTDPKGGMPGDAR